MGLCWPILRLCWPILRAMWAHLGAMLAHLGAMLAYLGAMLAQLGAMLAHLGAMLAQLGAMLAHLGGPASGFIMINCSHSDDVVRHSHMCYDVECARNRDISISLDNCTYKTRRDADEAASQSQHRTITLQ